MNSLFLGLATGFASCLTVKFLCKKLDIEKFISGKTSRRVGLVLIAFLFNIIGSLIINRLNVTTEYRFLSDSSFIFGPATSLFIWALPVKLNGNRHD